MAKSKKPKPQIVQGGVNITGNVDIKNSKISGRDTVEKNITTINVSFDPVYDALRESSSIPPDTKKALEDNVSQIEQEIKKGKEAQPSFIRERLENIQKMAPDIAEVVIATLQNPAAGLGLAIKKVVDKFKAEQI